MKIEKIKFKNHWLFNNLKMNFKDKQGELLDVIVIIGENGLGKTMFLNTIESAIIDNEHIFISNGRYKVDEKSYEVDLKDDKDGFLYYYNVGDFNLLNLDAMDNSIILIDTPEIGLHPKLQRKIISACKSIGENNQIIIATHSPFIIGDVKSEQIISLKRTKNGVIIGENNTETYGKTIDEILNNVMHTSSRNSDVETKLNRIYELLDRDEYETEEFDELSKYLIKTLGSLDKDIMRIRMQLSVKMNQRL